MGAARANSSQTVATIREPTIEQYIYYFRLVEGDSQEWRQARQRAFQLDLNSLFAHLEKASERPVTWSLLSLAASDPYVSQPVVTLDADRGQKRPLNWVFSTDGRRAYYVQARTYGDAYLLHVRYYRRGTWPLDIYENMLKNEVWTPWQEEQLLGRFTVFAGMTGLETGYALAAQILRRQVPPRHPIGTLETCGFRRSRLYRGSLHPNAVVLLYEDHDAEWTVHDFLDHWLLCWGFHYRKLDHGLLWCEQVSSSIEEQAVRLDQAMHDGRLETETVEWIASCARLTGQLAALRRRESVIESEWESLAWLLDRLEIEGPDTLLASSLNALRLRRQQLAAGLLRWQRIKDEATHAIANMEGLPALSVLADQGEPQRLGCSDERPLPALDLASIQELPSWTGLGWIPAKAAYFPDLSGSSPDWSSRRYDLLTFSVPGPPDKEGGPLRISSSVLGERIGKMPLSALAAVNALLATDEMAADIADRSIGEQLFQALLDKEGEELFRWALTLARNTGRGLRWQLEITDAPDLEAWPWELLFDAQEGIYPAASAETPFARVVSNATPTRPLLLESPLRLLVAIATPEDVMSRYGLAAFSAAEEAKTLSATLQPLTARGLLQVHTVVSATAAQIYREIHQFRPHVLLMLAHGIVRRGTEHLLLETEAHKGRLVDLRLLQEVIQASSDTRLSILGPAMWHLDEESLKPSIQALWRLARQLAQSGTCVTIGFQTRRSVVRQDTTGTQDLAMRRLIYELLRGLVLGNAVDVALAEARRVLLTEAGGEGVDWSAPRLFLPTPSAQIFQIHSNPPTDAR